jgi:hypothetical protein
LVINSTGNDSIIRSPFFYIDRGAGGGGPIKVSVCEKALPVTKNIATIKTEMNLAMHFHISKVQKYDKVFKINAVWKVKRLGSVLSLV